jgi:hypothetical protein
MTHEPKRYTPHTFAKAVNKRRRKAGKYDPDIGPDWTHTGDKTTKIIKQPVTALVDLENRLQREAGYIEGLQAGYKLGQESTKRNR